MPLIAQTQPFLQRNSQSCSNDGSMNKDLEHIIRPTLDEVRAKGRHAGSWKAVPWSLSLAEIACCRHCGSELHKLTGQRLQYLFRDSVIALSV